MAQEMTIRGTQAPVKIRSPWAVALLSIFTLGIYIIFWWYYVNRELRDYGEAKGADLGQNPTNSALAVFPGLLIVIPPLVSFWNGFKRVQAAAGLAGTEAPNGWIALILYLLISPAFFAYVQDSLNKVWEREADQIGPAAGLPEAAPAEAAPEPAPATPEPPAAEPPA